MKVTPPSYVTVPGTGAWSINVCYGGQQRVYSPDKTVAFVHKTATENISRSVKSWPASTHLGMRARTPARKLEYGPRLDDTTWQRLGGTLCVALPLAQGPWPCSSNHPQQTFPTKVLDVSRRALRSRPTRRSSYLLPPKQGVR